MLNDEASIDVSGAGIRRLYGLFLDGRNG
jgi:hypothetical protein